MCEAFDYMSQQRPLRVLLVGWHHLHTSDPVSVLMNKECKSSGALGGALQEKQMIQMSTQVSKLLQYPNFTVSANIAFHYQTAKCNRACLNPQWNLCEPE